MNKRAKKKAEKRIRTDMHKALDIVLDINGLGERKRELTGNLPTAFFNFSGHISAVSVDVHKDGWDPEGPFPDAFTCWRLDRMGSLLAWLEEMKKELGC